MQLRLLKLPWGNIGERRGDAPTGCYHAILGSVMLGTRVDLLLLSAVLRGVHSELYGVWSAT